jgi:hypothetical protein
MDTPITRNDEIGLQTDDLFGRQHIRFSLVALATKERVSSNLRIDPVRHDCHEGHLRAALWAERGRGFSAGLEHWKLASITDKRTWP